MIITVRSPKVPSILCCRAACMLNLAQRYQWLHRIGNKENCLLLVCMCSRTLCQVHKHYRLELSVVSLFPIFAPLTTVLCSSPFLSVYCWNMSSSLFEQRKVILSFQPLVDTQLSAWWFWWEVASSLLLFIIGSDEYSIALFSLSLMITADNLLFLFFLLIC